MGFKDLNSQDVRKHASSTDPIRSLVVQRDSSKSVPVATRKVVNYARFSIKILIGETLIDLLDH